VDGGVDALQLDEHRLVGILTAELVAVPEEEVKPVRGPDARDVPDAVLREQSPGDDRRVLGPERDGHHVSRGPAM
jgi:hypothetical protein